MLLPVEVVAVHPVVIAHPVVVESHVVAVPHATIVEHTAVIEEPHAVAKMPVVVPHVFPANPAQATSVARAASVAQPAMPKYDPNLHIAHTFAGVVGILLLAAFAFTFFTRRKK